MNLNDKIIQLFENNRNSYISIKYLSEKVNKSKKIIKENIKDLENKGYMFKKNIKGYCLDKTCNIISKPGIYLFLNNYINFDNFYIFDEIDSTNLFSKTLNITENNYSLVIANSQTNGRGRLGRTFYSPKDTGIYMSLSYKCKKDMINPINITSIASVAVCKAIEKLTGKTIGIKWVNDLFFNDRKICGILTEGLSNSENGYIDSIIVGIGLNLSTNSFPEEISNIAGSLCDSTISKNEIIGEIINNLDYYLNNFNNSDFLEIYKDRSIILNKKINYYINNIKYSGLCVDINNDGELLVLNDETKKIDILRTGEITVRINKE